MSCLKPHQMEDKVIRGLTLTDKEHLSRCEHCSTLYESILHEHQEWNSRLYSARVSEDFTTHIMNALEDVEIEPIDPNEEKRMTLLRQRNIKRWISAAAVVIVLGGAPITLCSSLLFSSSWVFKSRLSLGRRLWS